MAHPRELLLGEILHFMSHKRISVIIPTYNRAARLASTLDALTCSDFQYEQFEVIVVDDGSQDDTSRIGKNAYPFDFRYFYQRNQGDAIARNHGAQKSRGDLLVFLDDDISATCALLSNLARAHGSQERLIVAGTLIPASPDKLPELNQPDPSHLQPKKNSIDFTECHSGIQAIGRQDYLRLGMMQPLEIGGWSIWSDVELGYRAFLDGFSFVRSPEAVGYHHDYADISLKANAERMRRVGRAGVLLFQRHPRLLDHLAMFRDKTPIAWQQDPPGLILRKLVRPLSSSRPILKILEMAFASLEPFGYFVALTRVLERWIIGGHIFRGYRAGLREYVSLHSRRSSAL